MSKKPVICAISGDPGGANAILPVIELLQKEQRVTVINYAYNQAADIFARKQVHFATLPEKVDLQWLSQSLADDQSGFLLTATSCNTFNWEKHFIASARDQGMATLAVLDYWSNYIPRFADDAGCLSYLPDGVAVMDERAQNEMVALGFPEEIIHVLGQPAFDALEQIRKQFTLEKSQQIRQSLGMGQDELLVTFASQPLGALYGQVGQESYLGYDEVSVLNESIQALELIVQNNHKKITMVILPHPREEEKKYGQYHSSSVSIKVVSNTDNREMVLASDLVLGMTTVLLLEACYMHCIAMSLQPALCQKDTLVSNATAASIPVYENENIMPMIERYLIDKECRMNHKKKLAEIRPAMPASRCITDYIYEKITTLQKG